MGGSPVGVVVLGRYRASWGDLPDGWESLFAGPASDTLQVSAGAPFTHTDDAHPGPQTCAAEVGDLSPGVGLAAVLAEADVAGLSAYDLVEAAAGWQRMISWAQARQAGVLAQLSRRPEMQPGSTGYRSVNPVTNTGLEVAARTCITARQAENLVGHAVQLVEDFTATHAALEPGVIDDRRARVITGELGGHEPDIRGRVEAAVLPVAGGLDSVGLRRKVTALLHRLAPVAAEERCRQARQERYVAVTPASDGMAHLDALLPAEDAYAVKATLDAAADTTKRRDAEAGHPARTADQRRADALAAMAWASLTAGRLGGHRADCTGCACRLGEQGNGGSGGVHGAGVGASVPLAGAQGRPVTVHVTIPFTSLIGLDDQPADLAGYGPIPAQVGRHLAAAGVWQWVGTHPASGQVLDYGLTRYRPPQALVDFVVMRDRTCRARSCHHPAIRCDIDHRVPYDHGGPTSACNCQPLCKRHHLLKHHTRWRLDRLPTGAYAWTSPTGHRYVKLPERVGPVADDTTPPF